MTGTNLLALFAFLFGGGKKILNNGLGLSEHLSFKVDTACTV